MCSNPVLRSMHDEPSDFRDLVANACAADTTARAALIERLYPKVAHLVHDELARDFRRGHEWILPLFSTGDIVHDVLAKLCRDGLSALHDRSEGEAVRYLAKAVHHRLLDALRHHGADRRDARRHAGFEDADAAHGGPSAETMADLHEQTRVVQDVLAALPTRQRNLLEGRLLEGASFPDLAERLGYASHDVARKLFHEAHARLLLTLRARGVRPIDEVAP